MALLAGGTGCETTGHSDGSGACDTVGVTKQQIKLGFIYPDTGVSSSIFAASRAGIDARIGLANAQGGIHGRQLTYQWRDDGADPQTDGRVARDLVENSKVFGLVMSTTAASGSAQYLSDHGVPVTGLDTEPVWSQNPNMFSFVYPTESAIDTFGTYVKQNGGTRAVILTSPLSGAMTSYAEKLVTSMRSVGIDTQNIPFTPGAVAVQLGCWWADPGQEGWAAGGSQAPVVNSRVSTSRVSRPHFVAVDR